MIRSTTEAKYCPHCHRYHPMSDARGPGYCPPEFQLEQYHEPRSPTGIGVRPKKKK